MPKRAKSIDVDALSTEFAADLLEYGNEIIQEFNKGLGDAAEQIQRAEEQASPADSGDYKKSWITRKRGTTYRITNTKTVDSKKTNGIPLINILEYSPRSPHRGLVDAVYQAQIKKIMATIVNRIK